MGMSHVRWSRGVPSKRAARAKALVGPERCGQRRVMGDECRVGDRDQIMQDLWDQVEELWAHVEWRNERTRKE